MDSSIKLKARIYHDLIFKLQLILRHCCGNIDKRLWMNPVKQWLKDPANDI